MFSGEQNESREKKNLAMLFNLFVTWAALIADPYWAPLTTWEFGRFFHHKRVRNNYLLTTISIVHRD